MTYVYLVRDDDIPGFTLEPHGEPVGIDRLVTMYNALRLRCINAEYALLLACEDAGKDHRLRIPVSPAYWLAKVGAPPAVAPETPGITFRLYQKRVKYGQEENGRFYVFETREEAQEGYKQDRTKLHSVPAEETR